jgi:hypothetical protein
MRTTETDGVWSRLMWDLRSAPQSNSLPANALAGCSVLATRPRTSEPARPQWSCDPRSRPLDYWLRADRPARCVLPASMPTTAGPSSLCAQATDPLSAGRPDPVGPGCRPHSAVPMVLDGHVIHITAHPPPACLPRGPRDAPSWTTCQTLATVLSTALTCSVRLRSGLLGRCRWATCVRAAGLQSRYCGPPGCAQRASSPVTAGHLDAGGWPPVQVVPGLLVPASRRSAPQWCGLQAPCQRDRAKRPAVRQAIYSLHTHFMCLCNPRVRPGCSRVSSP